VEAERHRRLSFLRFRSETCNNLRTNVLTDDRDDAHCSHQGQDDDSADDNDIYLNWRTIYSTFDGESPNGTWRLNAWDYAANDLAYIDYFEVEVFYDPPAPVFSPYFYDAQITSRVDSDGDGYARQFDIEFDVLLQTQLVHIFQAFAISYKYA